MYYLMGTVSSVIRSISSTDVKPYERYESSIRIFSLFTPISAYNLNQSALIDTIQLQAIGYEVKW